MISPGGVILKSDTNLCTFSKVHKIFAPRLGSAGRVPHHITRMFQRPHGVVTKLEETVVTGLVMAITLGELLFWLPSIAHRSQRVLVVFARHMSD